jgi:hypothetical protein
MDLAVDQEFAKLVEEVCYLSTLLGNADALVLPGQEACLCSLSRPSRPRPR